MHCFVHKRDVDEVVSGGGHGSFPLLGAAHGCTGGCCTGISYYSATVYTPPAVHDDQEGFYVISGHGMARVAGEEFPIEPDMSFIAPAGAAHQIRSASADTPVVLFWFHAKA